MKRFIDLSFSLILILVTLPLLLLIALIIIIETPGRPLLKQKRVGQNSNEFIIYKFRTMHIDTPNIPTNELNDRNKYITKIGGFLRKTSLDELPQLFNILKGNMSFVGPRPPLFSQKILIEKRKKAGVDKLKPGITGYAQINGRDDIDDIEKFEYDFYYYKNQSMLLDLKIILLTLIQVIRGKGILENNNQKENSVNYSEEKKNIDL